MLWDKEVKITNFIFLIFGPLLALGAKDRSLDNSVIRVRLLSQQSEFQFEGFGVSFNGQQETIQSISIPQRTKWTVVKKIAGGKSFWQVTQTYPSYKNLIFNAEKPLLILGHDLVSGENHWQGFLQLVPSGDRKFDLISGVLLKIYLVGVLHGEMPKNWPLDTLKAQAIAARSYAQSVMKERKKMSFDVEADHRDQVYSSVVKTVFKAEFSRQEQAVHDTKNLILFEKNHLLKAYFHSDCGGEPTSAALVWGGSKKQGSVFPKSCAFNKKNDWSYSVDERELFGKMKALSADFDESLFSQFQWEHRPNQRRISEVLILLNNGKKLKLTSQEFRKAIGYGNLKSTLFTVDKKNGVYTFSGQGFGHGVGLCQRGARTMAQDGKKFHEILAHYYPEAQIVDGSRSQPSPKATAIF